MRLPALAIRNHQFTMVMVVMLTVMSLVSFVQMPRSEDPQVSFPGGNVFLVLPGASPEDMEQQVIDPLEEAIYELEGLRRLKSKVEAGMAVITVEFMAHLDADDKYDELVAAVNEVQPDLPESLARLEVGEITPTGVHILLAALVSDTVPYRQLKRQAELLERRLERVGGVQSADSLGYPEPEVRVALRPERMEALGLSIEEVIEAVRGSGANLLGGEVQVGRHSYAVHTSGTYDSIEEIRRTVVRGHAGRLVRLEDVADVAFGYADETYRVRSDGRRAVLITVLQREDTNIMRVVSDVRAELRAFERELPPSVSVDVVFDQSDSVAAQVGGFLQNLLQGLVLVGLVVFLSLGPRASLIVMLAIPLSLLIAIGSLDLGGYHLQQISIIGIVIALGLLVDNAIVVTENISRLRQRGLEGVEAAVQGSGEIGWAIVSSTVTTVLAFLPIALLRTDSGIFMRSMPLAVIFALVASLGVSLTLTPYLSSRFLKAESSGRWRPPLRRLLTYIAQGPYRRTLAAALGRPKTVLGIAVLAFLSSLLVFPLVGSSLFPKADKPMFLVNVDLPENTGLDHTDAVAGQVEALLLAREEVVHVATNIGRGNPRVYYNVFPQLESRDHAQLLVTLASDGARYRSDVVRAVRRELDAFPGAEVEVEEFQQGPMIEAPITLKVIGPDLQVLTDLATQIEGMVRDTPGTVNISNPASRVRTNLSVRIHRDKAALLGVSIAAIDRAVSAGILGLDVASFRDQEGEEQAVRIRLPSGDGASLTDLQRVRVTSATGAQVPLEQLATIEFEAGSTLIEHYGTERAYSVTASVDEQYNTAEVAAEVIEQVNALEVPLGYRVYIGGEQQSREESFDGMLQALLGALLGGFGILVLQFRSYRQPLIVFAAVPFALTGAIYGLLLTGYTFSFTAFIGLTSLVGIVVNNSIILVDCANQRAAAGLSVVDALVEAGTLRLSPIALTTFTTIGSLLPLTLTGSPLWSPMGTAIIGGLLVSTGLTLFVVPVLYWLLSESSR